MSLSSFLASFFLSLPFLLGDTEFILEFLFLFILSFSRVLCLLFFFGQE